MLTLDAKGNLIKLNEYDEFGVIKDNDVNEAKAFGYCSFNYDSHLDAYMTPSRVYNAKIGRFDSRDKIDYIHLENPSSVNLYTYCMNNPVLYVDYNGTDCYIYYLPEWKNQAVGDGLQLMEEYNLTEDQIHLVPLDENTDFAAEWNSMGTVDGQTVDIDCVVINTHANYGVLSNGKDSESGKRWSIYSNDVSKLDEKDVDALIMYGCNAGHKDNNNMAMAFSEKVNGAPVLASDGTVGTHNGGWFKTKYVSKADKSYRKQITDGIWDDGWKAFWKNKKNAKEKGRSENEGWVVYQNGQLVPDSSIGKKLTLEDMIDKLRDNGYICSI